MDKIALSRAYRRKYFELDKSFNIIFRSGRILNILKYPIVTIYKDHDSTGVGMMTPFLIIKSNLLDTEIVIN